MLSPFERFTRFFSRPAHRGGQEPIAVEGVWLRKEGARAIVLVQVDGEWVEVIRESVDAPFSHTVDAERDATAAAEAQSANRTMLTRS